MELKNKLSNHELSDMELTGVCGGVNLPPPSGDDTGDDNPSSNISDGIHRSDINIADGKVSNGQYIG